MARIQPFAAWRYNQEVVPNLADTLAPPYDRLDPTQAAKWRASHPYNIVNAMPVRGELTRSNVEEQAGRARATLEAWQREGAMRRDAEPGFYYYRQGFVDDEGQHRVRKSFFAVLNMDPEDRGMVLHQEADWVNPRVDRVRLLETTRMNLAPIMLLFSDPEREVMSLLTGAAAQVEPCAETERTDGTFHSIHHITDADTIAKVRDLLAPQTVLLADGHHRYRTAQAYATAHPEDAAARRLVACLVPIQDDGLALRPIHRAVTGVRKLAIDDLLFQLSQIFYIRELPADEAPGEIVDFALAEIAREAEDGEAAFVMALAGARDLLLLTVKNDTAKLVLPPGMAEPIRDLDVALLHRLILEGPLGLDPQNRDHGALLFFNDARKLPDLLAEDRAQVGFLLNPMRIPQLEAVIDARLKLPHKAARFCPDIPAGLVMQSLNETPDGEEHGTR